MAICMSNTKHRQVDICNNVAHKCVTLGVYGSFLANHKCVTLGVYGRISVGCTQVNKGLMVIQVIE